MSAHNGSCKHCGQPIWGVNKSDNEILWYHCPPGFGEPGRTWGKNFGDQSRKHCRDFDAVAEPYQPDTEAHT